VARPGRQPILQMMLAGALLMAAAAPPPASNPGWRRMAVAAGEPVTMRPQPPREGRRRCIDMRQAVSARLYGERALELTMRGGRHVRLFLAQACPALAFYQGFYYRPRPQGRLCAGQDVIAGRAGGDCAVASILPVGRAPR
jgi:hypothetical protein